MQICAVQLADLCTHSWVKQGRRCCFIPEWPAQIHPAPAGISSCCPEPALCRSGLPGKNWTLPALPHLPQPCDLCCHPGIAQHHCTEGSGCCADTGTSAGRFFMGHTRKRHLQGNVTAELPWCKTFSVYSWYSHNQSKCSVNTHNVVYKQLMGLSFADICAVGNAKALK